MLEKLRNWEVAYKRLYPKLLLCRRMVELVAGWWSHVWRMVKQGKTSENSTLKNLF